MSFAEAGTLRRLAVIGALAVAAAAPGTAGAYRASDKPVGYVDSHLHGFRLHTNDVRRAKCRDPWRLGLTAAELPPPGSAFRREIRLRWKRRHVGAMEAPAACNPVAIGRAMAAARGWVGSQWTALYVLWNRESGWNPCRHYPSTTNCAYTGSSACGIPQRVPCNGLIGWSPRAQIRWGLGYIAGRYGTPTRALAHSNAVGWY